MPAPNAGTRLASKKPTASCRYFSLNLLIHSKKDIDGELLERECRTYEIPAPESPILVCDLFYSSTCMMCREGIVF